MYQAKSTKNQVCKGPGGIKVAHNSLKHILVLDFFLNLMTFLKTR